jgi:hypothetical protein
VRILALLVKEAVQHTGAMFGATVMMVGMWMMALSFALNTEASTLLTAATGLVYYAMPLAIAYVLRRLVVLEYDQHTHDFLAGLPVSAFLHTALKYVLGLGLVSAYGVVAVVITAAISSRQELISARFLLQVNLQVLVYTFAWYGLTFAAAHLGRYRFTFWLLAIALMLSLEQLDPDIYKDVLWHSALAESLDVTRLAVPWGALALSMAWGVAGTGIGMWLGSWQQGALCAGWFTPMSSREKTFLVLVVSVSWLSVDLIEYVYVAGGPSYTRMKDVGHASVTVRTTADPRLTAIGSHVAERLHQFGVAVGDDSWPTIVLVPVLQDADEDVHWRSFEHDELVLEVDLDNRDHALVTAVVYWALQHRSRSMPAIRGDMAWVAYGAASWWVGPDPLAPDLYPQRAGYAALSGVDEGALVDSLLLEQRVGPEIAEAVGWAGLSVIEQTSGRPAVEELLGKVLRRRRSARVLEAVRTDLSRPTAWMERAAGTDVDGFRADWAQALKGYQVQHAATLNAARPEWGMLSRTSSEVADVVLVSDWPGRFPKSDVELFWFEVPALHSRPLDYGPASAKDESIVMATQSTPISWDLRAPVAVTYAVHSDLLDCELWSGLRVLR